MNLGIMAMKEYFTFFIAPGLDPNHRMHFSVIPRTVLKETYLYAEVQSTYCRTQDDKVEIEKKN